MNRYTYVIISGKVYRKIRTVDEMQAERALKSRLKRIRRKLGIGA